MHLSWLSFGVLDPFEGPVACLAAHWKKTELGLLLTLPVGRTVREGLWQSLSMSNFEIWILEHIPLVWWIELDSRLGLVPHYSPVSNTDLLNDELISIYFVSLNQYAIRGHLHILCPSSDDPCTLGRCNTQLTAEPSLTRTAAARGGSCSYARLGQAVCEVRTNLSCSKLIDLLAFVNFLAEVLHPFAWYVNFSLLVWETRDIRRCYKTQWL